MGGGCGLESGDLMSRSYMYLKKKALSRNGSATSLLAKQNLRVDSVEGCSGVACRKPLSNYIVPAHFHISCIA